MTKNSESQDRENLEGFQAEYDFVVCNGKIVAAELVLNETFDNELHVAFSSDKKVSVRDFDGGGFSPPSYLQFMESGDVNFSLLFTDHSAGQGHNQTEFVVTLWQLAWLGFIVDMAKSRNREFAYEVGNVMLELKEIQSSSEIEVTRCYGLFF